MTSRNALPDPTAPNALVQIVNVWEDEENDRLLVKAKWQEHKVLLPTY